MKGFAKLAACTMAMAMAFFLASCDGNKIAGFGLGNDSTTVVKNDSAAADSVKIDSTSVGYKMRPGKKVEGKLIALTFDDGPNCKITPRILNTLKKYNAHATFFVVGECIDSATSEVMRRAVSEGNEIACHTWTHPFLTRISSEQRKDEVTKTCNAIQKAVGIYPNFFRPPYIDCDSLVLDDINMPGISGFSSDDWKPSSSPSFIIDNVLKHAAPGTIVVMHDLIINERTPVAIETIIPKLQSMGYTLVTMTDLFTSLGIDPKPHLLYSSATNSNRGFNKHVRSNKAKSESKGEGKKEGSKSSSKDSKSSSSSKSSKDSKSSSTSKSSKDSKSSSTSKSSKDSKSSSSSKSSKDSKSGSSSKSSSSSSSKSSSEPVSAPAKEAVPAKETAPAKSEPTGQAAN